LQCVAVCCSVVQCVAMFCSLLQCVAVCCSVLQCVAVCCSVLLLIYGLREHLSVPVAVCDSREAKNTSIYTLISCSMLQRVAVFAEHKATIRTRQQKPHCNALLHPATRQLHTATLCNVLQDAATKCTTQSNFPL